MPPRRSFLLFLQARSSESSTILAGVCSARLRFLRPEPGTAGGVGRTGGSPNVVPSPQISRYLHPSRLYPSLASPALVRRATQVLRRGLERSTPVRLPLLSIKSARKENLGPGAQQRSRTRSPGLGLRAHAAAALLTSRPNSLPSRYACDSTTFASPGTAYMNGSHITRSHRTPRASLTDLSSQLSAPSTNGLTLCRRRRMRMSDSTSHGIATDRSPLT